MSLSPEEFDFIHDDAMGFLFDRCPALLVNPHLFESLVFLIARHVARARRQERSLIAEVLQRPTQN